MLRHEVTGEAVEGFRSDPDLPAPLADVPCEDEAEFAVARRQFLHANSRRLVEVRAASTEIAQQLLVNALGCRIQSLDTRRGEYRREFGIRHQRCAHRIRIRHALLRGGANRAIGMNLPEKMRFVPHAVQLDLQVVPEPERLHRSAGRTVPELRSERVDAFESRVIPRTDESRPVCRIRGKLEGSRHASERTFPPAPTGAARGSRAPAGSECRGHPPSRRTRRRMLRPPAGTR